MEIGGPNNNVGGGESDKTTALQGLEGPESLINMGDFDSDGGLISAVGSIKDLDMEVEEASGIVPLVSTSSLSESDDSVVELEVIFDKTKPGIEKPNSNDNLDSVIKCGSKISNGNVCGGQNNLSKAEDSRQEKIESGVKCPAFVCEKEPINPDGRLRQLSIQILPEDPNENFDPVIELSPCSSEESREFSKADCSNEKDDSRRATAVSSEHEISPCKIITNADSVQLKPPCLEKLFNSPHKSADPIKALSLTSSHESHEDKGQCLKEKVFKKKQNVNLQKRVSDVFHEIEPDSDVEVTSSTEVSHDSLVPKESEKCTPSAGAVRKNVSKTPVKNKEIVNSDATKTDSLIQDESAATGASCSNAEKNANSIESVEGKNDELEKNENGKDKKKEETVVTDNDGDDDDRGGNDEDGGGHGGKDEDDDNDRKREEEEKEKKKRSSIKKLESLMAQLSAKIKRLDEKELSLHDMENESIYTKTELYKKKLVLVWQKLCKVKKEPASTGRETEKKFVFTGSKHPQVDKAVSKFVNKFNIFPDYQDVLEIVTTCNDFCKLNLSKQTVSTISRETFTQVGKLLKKRRIKDYKEDFGCHLTDDLELKDPALEDLELSKKLEENKKQAANKMAKTIEHFTTLAEKVGDDEGESEEEEEDDEDEIEEKKDDNSDDVDGGGGGSSDDKSDDHHDKSGDSSKNESGSERAANFAKVGTSKESRESADVDRKSSDVSRGSSVDSERRRSKETKSANQNETANDETGESNLVRRSSKISIVSMGKSFDRKSSNEKESSVCVDSDASRCGGGKCRETPRTARKRTNRKESQEPTCSTPKVTDSGKRTTKAVTRQSSRSSSGSGSSGAAVPKERKSSPMPGRKVGKNESGTKTKVGDFKVSFVRLVDVIQTTSKDEADVGKSAGGDLKLNHLAKVFTPSKVALTNCMDCRVRCCRDSSLTPVKPCDVGSLKSLDKTSKKPASSSKTDLKADQSTVKTSFEHAGDKSEEDNEEKNEPIALLCQKEMKSIKTTTTKPHSTGSRVDQETGSPAKPQSLASVSSHGSCYVTVSDSDGSEKETDKAAQQQQSQSSQTENPMLGKVVGDVLSYDQVGIYQPERIPSSQRDGPTQPIQSAKTTEESIDIEEEGLNAEDGVIFVSSYTCSTQTVSSGVVPSVIQNPQRDLNTSHQMAARRMGAVPRNFQRVGQGFPNKRVMTNPGKKTGQKGVLRRVPSGFAAPLMQRPENVGQTYPSRNYNPQGVSGKLQRRVSPGGGNVQRGAISGDLMNSFLDASQNISSHQLPNLPPGIVKQINLMTKQITNKITGVTKKTASGPRFRCGGGFSAGALYAAASARVASAAAVGASTPPEAGVALSTEGVSDYRHGVKRKLVDDAGYRKNQNHRSTDGASLPMAKKRRFNPVGQDPVIIVDEDSFQQQPAAGQPERIVQSANPCAVISGGAGSAPSAGTAVNKRRTTSAQSSVSALRQIKKRILGGPRRVTGTPKDCLVQPSSVGAVTANRRSPAANALTPQQRRLQHKIVSTDSDVIVCGEDFDPGKSLESNFVCSNQTSAGSSSAGVSSESIVPGGVVTGTAVFSGTELADAAETSTGTGALRLSSGAASKEQSSSKTSKTAASSAARRLQSKTRSSESDVILCDDLSNDVAAADGMREGEEETRSHRDIPIEDLCVLRLQSFLATLHGNGAENSDRDVAPNAGDVVDDDGAVILLD